MNQHKTISCKECRQQFLSEDELKKHVMQDHDQNKILAEVKCTLCFFKAKHYTELINHHKTHNTPEGNECPECKFQCISESVL